MAKYEEITNPASCHYRSYGYAGDDQKAGCQFYRLADVRTVPCPHPDVFKRTCPLDDLTKVRDPVWFVMYETADDYCFKRFLTRCDAQDWFDELIAGFCVEVADDEHCSLYPHIYMGRIDRRALVDLKGAEIKEL